MVSKASFLSTFLILLLLTKLVNAQTGVIKSYYPDRIIKSEITYVNDILDGSSSWYYPNGKIKLKKYFSKGILNGWVREYYENGNLKEEYNVKNGIIDGDKKKYFEDGTLERILSYSDGRLINAQQFDQLVFNTSDDTDSSSTNKKQKISRNISQKSIIRTISGEDKKEDVFVQPVPVGGLNAIQEIIVYPKDALSYGLEGTVILTATIDRAGQVRSIIIEKSIGLGCDEAATSAVKSTKFFPGKKNDDPIESSITLSLVFKLPIKKEELTKVEQMPEAKPQVSLYEERLSLICEADKCPRPEDDLAKIYTQIEIPNVAKALKLRGMVIIEGIVDKGGKLRETKIIEGVGYGCDQQVESALLKSKFTPAAKKGEIIEAKVLIYFPFTYEMAQ